MDRPVRALLKDVWRNAWGRIAAICGSFFAAAEIAYHVVPDDWATKVPRLFTVIKWLLENFPPWLWLLLTVIAFAAGTFKVLAVNLANSTKVQEPINKKLAEVEKALVGLADFRTHVWNAIRNNELLFEYTFLSFAETRLEQVIGAYERSWHRVLRQARENDQENFGDMNFNDATSEFLRASREIEKFAEESLGIKEILHEHPNFTEDPLKIVDGEDSIPESRRKEFRRLTDIYKTAETRIRHIQGTLESRMKPSKDRLKHLGRK